MLPDSFREKLTAVVASFVPSWFAVSSIDLWLLPARVRSLCVQRLHYYTLQLVHEVYLQIADLHPHVPVCEKQHSSGQATIQRQAAAILCLKLHVLSKFLGKTENDSC